MKLDKFIKNFLPLISSKNPLDLLIIKFIIKLIEERDISMQKTCYLLLNLDLTSSSYLVSNMDIQPLQTLTCVLLFIYKRDYIPKDTYLKRYCSHDDKLEARTLYKMYMLYNYSLKLCFTMQIWGKPIVLNVYLLYLSDLKHYDYKQFYRIKIMFHYLFRSKDLDNLSVLEDGFLTANWQLVYKKCLAHHSLHLFDALRVYWQELDNNLDMKNVEQNDANDIKNEELLSMHKTHYDDSWYKLETDFGQRL